MNNESRISNAECEHVGNSGYQKEYCHKCGELVFPERAVDHQLPDGYTDWHIEQARNNTTVLTRMGILDENGNVVSEPKAEPPELIGKFAITDGRYGFKSASTNEPKAEGDGLEDAARAFVAEPPELCANCGAVSPPSNKMSHCSVGIKHDWKPEPKQDDIKVAALAKLIKEARDLGIHRPWEASTDNIAHAQDSIVSLVLKTFKAGRREAVTELVRRAKDKMETSVNVADCCEDLEAVQKEMFPE